MEKPLLLIVTDHGDRSVGIFSCSWKIECPFTKEEMNLNLKDWFRTKIIELYGEFAEGRITADYDFECMSDDTFDHSPSKPEIKNEKEEDITSDT